MIDVEAVLREVPHFDVFCSVEKLHALAESLRGDRRFQITVVGHSARGVPIYHVRFGTGSVRALVVAFPHCMEPIGGLTAFSLLTLLRDGNRALLEADVEWHIVPCIDPDGAMLNEGWTQKPFTFDNYMRHYYVQETVNQVDATFPISYKKMTWSQPSREAGVLKELLDRIRPDFFFSLHNTRTGGAFYYISRDVGPVYYQQIYSLLERHDFPLQKHAQWKEVLAEFAPGVLESVEYRKFYDYFERIMPDPQKTDLLKHGVGSWEYLKEIKPDALSFTAEMGYVVHPGAESTKDTGQNLRRIKLKIDADNKFLGSIILDEWEKVKGDLDTRSPFYKTVIGGWVLPDRDKLCEGGLPVARYPTQEVLFNPQYDRPMTEADLLNACMVDGGFFYHLFAYQLVRLLKASPQTSAVQNAIARLERVFDDAHAELARYVDFGAFKVVPCDKLAKVQLGSGLIALNAVLDARS